MNLLQLVQTFCTRTGVTPPATLTGANDQQIQQILALLGAILEDLTDENWTGLSQEAVFTTTGAESQGLLTVLAPNGFQFILPETLFDRTLRLPLYGPLSAEDWQAFKALPTSGPFYKYRVARGELLFSPVPPNDHTCAFEYQSSFIVQSADGTAKPLPTADTDVFNVPDKVILAGLRWQWKYEKGLEYAEDFRRYETFRNNAKSRDGTKPTLSLSAHHARPQPGIFVPAGNWKL